MCFCFISHFSARKDKQTAAHLGTAIANWIMMFEEV